MIWAALVSCLISSYWLGFDEPSFIFFIVTRIVEFLFYIDFVLNFLTATKHHITLIETNDLISIVKQYFFGYALRDFIALIPFESLFNDTIIIKLCLMLRLLRI